MFRILCDPSSGSTELCLKLLVVIQRCFIVCLVGVYGPAGPYTHTTGSKLRCQTPTKHTTKHRWTTSSNFSQAQLLLPDDGSHKIRNMS